MARMNVSNPMDDGYPMSRVVDGTNVKECAATEGWVNHLGHVRKFRKTYINSKTGATMERPEGARYDFDARPERGY